MRTIALAADSLSTPTVFDNERYADGAWQGWDPDPAPGQFLLRDHCQRGHARRLSVFSQ